MQDETEFRDMLLARESDNNAGRVNDMKKMAIRKNLQDVNAFEVPEEFLLNWLNHQREQQVEPGSRQAKSFLRDTKWSLLLTKIQDDKNILVTEKDIQKQGHQLGGPKCKLQPGRYPQIPGPAVQE
jgi:hypothetical protein